MRPAARRAAASRATTATIGIALLGATGCRPGAVWSALTPELSSRLEVYGRGGKHCVRLRGLEQGCFDGVDVHSIAFDSAGEHAAYAVRVGARWGIAVDGRAGPLFGAVGAPQLSPDGKHVAHAAEAAGGWVVVRNGVTGDPFDAVVTASLRFDRSGNHVAYVARRGAGMHVVLDSAVSPPWQTVGELVFGPTGTNAPALHFSARNWAGWLVVSAGRAAAVFDSVRALAVLPDGRPAYVAIERGRESLVIGVDRGAAHQEILTVAIGADGRSAYLARDDTSVAGYAADGRPFLQGALIDLALGTAGRAAWVRAAGDRQEVVAPGGTFVYDLVVAGTLQFLDDGATWTALVGDRARRKLHVVIDGRVTVRTVDWSELTRRVQQGTGAEGLRSFVAAEARRSVAR